MSRRKATRSSPSALIEAEEIEDDLLDEILAEDEEAGTTVDGPSAPSTGRSCRRRSTSLQLARQLGAQHRHRHQDADAAQGAGHRLRADGDDGRGAQGADLHRIAPNAGLPEGVPGVARLRGPGRALQRHQRRSGGHRDLRALGQRRIATPAARRARAPWTCAPR